MYICMHVERARTYSNLMVAVECKQGKTLLGREHVHLRFVPLTDLVLTRTEQSTRRSSSFFFGFVLVLRLLRTSHGNGMIEHSTNYLFFSAVSRIARQGTLTTIIFTRMCRD